MQNQKWLVSLAIGTVALLGLWGSPASGQLSSVGTANIDGVKSPGEWDGAATKAIGSGPYAGSTLLVMNDATNLYVAVEIQGDPDLTASDAFTVRFDNDRDLVNTAGDDELMASETTYVDAYFSGTNWGIGDWVQHGQGSGTRVGGVNFIEVAKPLSSGDTQDFSLSAGDDVGFCLRYFQNGSSVITDPANCQLGSSQQALYDVITIATVSVPALGPAAIGALVLSIGLLGAHARRMAPVGRQLGGFAPR